MSTAITPPTIAEDMKNGLESDITELFDLPRHTTPPPVPNFVYEKYSVCPGVGTLIGRWHVMRENFTRTRKCYRIGEGRYQSDKSGSATYSFAEATRIVEDLMQRPMRMQVDNQGNPVLIGDPEFVNPVGLTPVYKNGVVIRYEMDKIEAEQ